MAEPLRGKNQDIQVFLEEMYADGEWVRVPKSLLLIMDGGHALFLSYLMNVSRLCRAHERTGGWFYHTHKQIEKEAYLRRWSQDRMLSWLRKKGYLQTELRGLPARRYVRIDFARVREDVVKARAEWELQLGVADARILGVAVPLHQGASVPLHQRRDIDTRTPTESSLTEGEGKDTQSPGRMAGTTGCLSDPPEDLLSPGIEPNRREMTASAPTEKKDREKLRSPAQRPPSSGKKKAARGRRPVADPSIPTLAEEDEEKEKSRASAQSSADLLYREVKKKSKLRRKPTGWVRQFILLESELSETDTPAGREAARKDIAAVLGWYVERIGEKFVPEAFAGESFRRKFDSICEAKRKWEEEAGFPPTSSGPCSPLSQPGKPAQPTDTIDYDEIDAEMAKTLDAMNFSHPSQIRGDSARECALPRDHAGRVIDPRDFLSEGDTGEGHEPDPDY